MKFYVTTESYSRVRSSFTNLNSFYIIDVDSILGSIMLDPDKKSHRYIINTEIGRLISMASKSKRYGGIIYINSKINCETIVGLRTMIDSIEKSRIECMVLLDVYDNPKNVDYYGLFDELLFFPTYSKNRINECKPAQICDVLLEMDSSSNSEK